MNKKINLKRVIPFGFLLLLGAMSLLTSVVILAKSGALLINSEEGIGSAVHEANGSIRIVYYDKSGRSHLSYFKNIFASFLEDGQNISVLYDKNSPDVVCVNGVTYLWMPGIMFLLFGVFGGLIGFIGIDIQSLRGGQRVDDGDRGGSEKRSSQSKNEQNKGSSAQTSDLAVDSSLHSRIVADNLFGILTPLIEDAQVSDIIIESANCIFVKIGGQIKKASLTFPSQLKYEQLVERMLTACDTSYTIAKPIVDGMVTPLVRIHAVHKVLCERGPYVTLRVSRMSTVKYAEFIQGTMAPREVMNYLRAMLLTGNTILLAGEVGTGKTTLLRALGSTIPKAESILVIEDTAEINIEHPNVRSVRTRESNTEGVGKVSPGECIRAGMRMAMNRIIFGEIRDPEAAESFIDVCVSGHPGMSTIHAKSAKDAVSRLELLLARQQPGVDRHTLKDQIGGAVQAIAYTQICRITGQRRITEVIELFCDSEHSIKMQDIFTYVVTNGVPGWKVMSRKSYFDDELKGFEGGYSLERLPDVISLAPK